MTSTINAVPVINTVAKKSNRKMNLENAKVKEQHKVYAQYDAYLLQAENGGLHLPKPQIFGANSPKIISSDHIGNVKRAQKEWVNTVAGLIKYIKSSSPSTYYYWNKNWYMDEQFTITAKQKARAA